MKVQTEIILDWNSRKDKYTKMNLKIGEIEGIRNYRWYGMSAGDLKKNLETLFTEQNLAVLASCHENEPYTNLVAFAASDDLRYIFFVTPVSTRKYSYLSSSGTASMMIDNRSNKEDDFKDAIAANANGNVIEIEKTHDVVSLYLEKHPHLRDFIKSPSSALMRMEVRSYIIASSFQNVVELKMR